MAEHPNATNSTPHPGAWVLLVIGLLVQGLGLIMVFDGTPAGLADMLILAAGSWATLGATITLAIRFAGTGPPNIPR